MRGALESIEAAFFGAVPDAELTLRRSGWTPDHPWSYCPTCGGTVGVGELDGEQRCSACRGASVPWSRAIRLGVYTGELRDAIHAMKFHGERRCARRLGLDLGVAIADFIARDDRPAATLVPVPSTIGRRVTRHRGVDHTLTLARAASEACGAPVRRLLDRSPRPPQSSLPVSKRRANVRGAFYPRPGATPPKEGVVVLIDDIRTTGATLAACCGAVAAAYGVTTGSRREGWRRRLIVATVAVAGESRRAARK